MADRNARTIQEFRSNHGKVGGPFEGAPMLLLTHSGAKSGIRRTNPLMYQPHEGRVFVFASKGGAPRHPHWFLNITANPDVTVEIGDEAFEATAIEVLAPSATRSTSARPRSAHSSVSIRRTTRARSRWWRSSGSAEHA